MATQTVSRNDLVGVSSLSFMRGRDISYTITDTKPNTPLYAFFDGKPVGTMITPTGSSLGAPIITNAAGETSGVFHLPGSTFNTGAKKLVFQDQSVLDTNPIPGSTNGSAEATYTSTGMLETYRETYTTTVDEVVINEHNTVEGSVIKKEVKVTQYLRDPIAQTFFTYGVKGGCFITKIDVFFQSKDSNLPVRLELRKVVNGYPAIQTVSEHAFVSLNPVSINTSNTAALPTSFVFSRPIYLEENQEYCFVLQSNSNAYNVWTSKMSERSIETGKIIFEQPFIGTMFKSENNITWSAEQTEDIKFTLYKAQFNTAVNPVLNWKFTAQQILIDGTSMSVTSGSPVVTVTFKNQHGNKTGDFVQFIGQLGAVYRGIPSLTISNTAGFAITYIDDNRLSFNCGVNATSTGTLTTSGVINKIAVDVAGLGYVSPTITISAPMTNGVATVGGVQATATATVIGGKIIDVAITNAGSGYVDEPTVSVSDSGGSGANLAIISEAIFGVTTNRRYQNIAVISTNFTPTGTSIDASVITANEDYTRNETAYQSLVSGVFTNKLCVIPNSKVETAAFGVTPSTQLNLTFNSDNPNVSPMLDTGKDDSQLRIRVSNFMVNEISNAESELSASSGTAQSRYISKIMTLATMSKGARILVNACSVNDTWFEVYLRTSMSASTSQHSAGNWFKMHCDTDRNRSSNWNDFLDYEFNLDNNVATGTITTLTSTNVVTGSGTSFAINDIGKPVYSSGGVYLGTIATWVSPTSVTLVNNSLSAVTGSAFSMNGLIEPFDTYDIKIVLYSKYKYVFPKIANYRCVILAT